VVRTLNKPRNEKYRWLARSTNQLVDLAVAVSVSEMASSKQSKTRDSRLLLTPLKQAITAQRRERRRQRRTPTAHATQTQQHLRSLASPTCIRPHTHTHTHTRTHTTHV
jgi:hypothetical protein